MKLLISVILTTLFFKMDALANLIINIKSLNSDTIHLYIVIDDATNDVRKIPLVKKNNVFSFTCLNDTARMIRIADGKNFIYGVIEKDDRVTIGYDLFAIDQTFNVTGNGATKYFPDQKKRLTARLNASYDGIDTAFKDRYVKTISELESKILDSIAEGVNAKSASFSMIKGYYKAYFNYSKRRLLNRLYRDIPLLTISARTQINVAIRVQAEQLLDFDNDLYNSPEYINDVYYCLLQEYMSLKLNNQVSGDIDDKYRFYLKHLPQKELRERVLCILLETDFMSLNDTEYLAGVSQNEYTNASSRYAKYVENLRLTYGSLFGRGDKAPRFSLTDTAGNNIGLNDLAGKVVVMDFWYESCAPCLALFEAMRPLKEKFRDKPVVFLTISLDKKDKWLKAIKRLNIRGYHVYTQELKDEHAIITDYRVNGYPTVCIVDKEGNFFNASPPVGNMAALLTQIEMAFYMEIGRASCRERV